MRVLIAQAAAAIPVALLTVTPASADPFFFSTGDVTNSIATAAINSATFTGLLTGGATTANIAEVRVEIYRVFPNDSNVARTSGPPIFSTPQVPTRVNSPSDVEFADRDTSPPPGNLTFTTKDLGAFSALNSVQPGGIHPVQ